MANPAETAYLSVRDGKLSNAVWLVEFQPRKVAVHTFFGVVPSRAALTAFVSELSKAIIFCLRSYPGEISHPNSANREISIDVSVLVLRRRKVALHTISHLRQLKRDEALFPPLGRVVEFQARYWQIPVRGFFLGGGQNLETV